MDFTLNGAPASADVGPGEHLLEVLRDRCGVTSVKDGCASEGSCGACTVIVDGKAVVSCAQPAEHCVFVEEHQPEGPYGAKGIGEIGLVPTASAVAGALHAFDGRHRTRLPVKDSPAAAAAVPRLARR